MQSETLQNVKLPMPLPILIVIQIIPQALLFGVLIALGLFFAKRIGLGTPILEARLAGERVAARVRELLPLSILLGVLVSVLIVGLDAIVFQPAMHMELGNAADALKASAQPAAWKGLLVSFYGGIVEEILLRLFAMSFLAWLGSFISKTSGGKPTAVIFWLANILAAVLFGLGHLPITAALITITPLVVARAIILNGLGGIAFGYLYWKRGLEAAMISHFSADIVLHVLLAL
jgi:membrane protease YdiL (CAAX protease family)